MFQISNSIERHRIACERLGIAWNGIKGLGMAWNCMEWREYRTKNNTIGTRKGLGMAWNSMAWRVISCEKATQLLPSRVWEWLGIAWNCMDNVNRQRDGYPQGSGKDIKNNTTGTRKECLGIAWNGV